MKKTQKSFKKKALLSSVSMLMVATVAVGSATFAWFKSNPNANASGLSLKATASNGLVIMTETHVEAKGDSYTKSVDDFVTTDYLYFDPAKIDYTGADSKTRATAFALTPASLDLSAGVGGEVGAAYNTLAESNTSYAAGTTSTVNAVEVDHKTTSYVYKEAIYCALSGSTNPDEVTDLRLDKLSVKFNSNASALKNALRVVIAYEDKDGNETIFGQYALADKNAQAQTIDRTNVMLKGTIAPNTKYTDLTDTNKGTVTFAPLTLAADTTYAFTPSTTGNANRLTTALGQSGDDKVNVYIYLDGEDDDCFSQRITADNIIDSVKVDLSIPTT